MRKLNLEVHVTRNSLDPNSIENFVGVLQIAVAPPGTHNTDRQIETRARRWHRQVTTATMSCGSRIDARSND